MTVPVGLESIIVEAPGVETIKVTTDSGSNGQRGTQIYAANGHPLSNMATTDGGVTYFFEGRKAAAEDLYFDLANSRVYRYVTPLGGGNLEWQEARTTSDIYAMGAPSIDFKASFFQTYTVTSNTTFTDTNMFSGGYINLFITNNSANVRTLTWPTNWSWLNYKPLQILGNQTLGFQIFSTSSSSSGVRASSLIAPATESFGTLPSDLGLLAYNYDPGASASNSGLALGAGVINVMKLRTDIPITVSNIYMHLITVGATLTSGQNFAALYNSSKQLLASTADQTSAWTTGTGLKTMALTTPQLIQPGFFYVAIWSNGTTRPSWWRANSSITTINGILSAEGSRWATAGTATTTAPSSLGAFTVSPNSYWVGVS